MSDDIFHDPDFKAWAADVQENLVPKLADSAVTVSLFPTGGEADVKYAVELGFSIMMDKPIFIVAAPGQVLPKRLERVADAVVFADISTEQGKRHLMAEVHKFMDGLDE